MNSLKILTLSLCLLLSLVFGRCASDGECIPADRAMLLRIKHAFSFPQSRCWASWIPDSNCCNWTGVTCHAESRHVTGLTLVDCGISGKLPNDFFTSTKNLKLINLTDNPGISGVFPEFPKNSALQTLRLSNTSLSGSIPHSVRNLKHLTYLGIRDMIRMTGKLPPSIGNLTKLTTLVLFGSGFTDEIPSFIGNLDHLSHLSLGYNNFKGTVPKSIGNLRKLITLNLAGNTLLGEIRNFIGNLIHLSRLRLGENNFKGVIPEFIGNFVNLTYVDLWSNNFTGMIPSSIKHLSQLWYLDLSKNSISGPIPMSLFSLRSIETVRLNHNHLSGRIDEFFNLSITLTYIDLSCNQIEGQIPKSLFKLSALGLLRLTSNNLFGTVDLDLVATLKTLYHIDISYNKIWVQESNYNYFHNFPALYWLGFASCNLTKIPEFLILQKQIHYVDISDNKISGNIPKWLWTLENLIVLNISKNLFFHLEDPAKLQYSSMEDVDLSYNMMHGPIPLPPLVSRYLDYSNNNFSSNIPANLSLYLNETLFLSFANNKLTGEIPHSIGQSASNLRVLDFSNNIITGPIPLNMLNIRSLVLLKLNGNRLEGAFPSHIGKGCQLSAIFVGDNRLNGTLPRSLDNCSALEVIDIANNHISEPFPLWFGNFANLSVLTLKGNRFYGPIEFTENIGPNNQFSKIQVMDISFNNFSGSLPFKLLNNFKSMKNTSTDVPKGVEYASYRFSFIGVVNFYYMPSVMSGGYSSTLSRIREILYTFVDFSNNIFEGDIPNIIGELNGLHILNLSHNALTGDIPSSIGKMKQLEKLDLSDNNLSGNIPQELASLNFLSHLNLSKNNLSGVIQQTGQLLTFTNDSFNDNPGLCGSPLSKLCGNNSSSTINLVHSDSDSDSTYMIGMALSVGLGYGLGIAIVFICQTMSWKYWIEKISNMQSLFQR